MKQWILLILFFISSVFFSACQKEGVIPSLESKFLQSPKLASESFFTKLKERKEDLAHKHLPNYEEYHALLLLWDKEGKVKSGYKTLAGNYITENVKHLRRWMDVIEIQKLEFVDIHLSKKVQAVGPYRLHRNVLLELKDPSGKTHKVQIFKSLLEHDGKFLPWSIKDTRN